MPYSDPVSRDVVSQYIQSLDAPKGFLDILDVGVGSGTYGELLKTQGIPCKITGLEIWEPYVEKFQKVYTKFYDKVYITDAYDYALLYSSKMEHTAYDIAIFGDVLEHLEEKRAQYVFERIPAKHKIIVIPIVHYPQGAEFGNPFEVHRKEDYTIEEVQRVFGPAHTVFNLTQIGVFIYE